MVNIFSFADHMFPTVTTPLCRHVQLHMAGQKQQDSPETSRRGHARQEFADSWCKVVPVGLRGDTLGQEEGNRVLVLLQ